MSGIGVSKTRQSSSQLLTQWLFGLGCSETCVLKNCRSFRDCVRDMQDDKDRAPVYFLPTDRHDLPDVQGMVTGNP